MKNRQLDVTLLLQVLVLRRCVILPPHKSGLFNHSEDIVKKIDDPAYQVGTIPANTYEGQTADVQTIAVQNFLVTREGVSTDTVYKMTKSMFENLDQMVAAHAAAKDIKKENAIRSLPAPLHPGAEKLLPRNWLNQVIL